jgi:MFS superfamily sulfate permease-like transporter
VLVVRVDGPLFFADADRVRDTLKEMIDGVESPVRAVVVGADAISQTDTDGADIVSLIAGAFRTRGITLALARVEPSILALWTRAGAVDAVGTGRVFVTVREAVKALEGTTLRTLDRQADGEGRHPRHGAEQQGAADAEDRGARPGASEPGADPAEE